MVATSLVMVAILCAGGCGDFPARQAHPILGSCPKRRASFCIAHQHAKGQPNTMQKVQAAARDSIRRQARRGIPYDAKQTPPHVVVDRPRSIWRLLVGGSMGALAFISQATMVLILVFFLLLAGDTFKRKLVRMTGPIAVDTRKITVQILDDITYPPALYVHACWWPTSPRTPYLGSVPLDRLENAGAWAVAAGVLHVIPYFGPVLIAVATGNGGLHAIRVIRWRCWCPDSSLAIALSWACFLITWMTGKIAKMNAAAVFIALLFWDGYGGYGACCSAIPIIGIVKVRLPACKDSTLDELLGEETNPHSVTCHLTVPS